MRRLRVLQVAKTVEDISKFMENMEATGAFARTESKEEQFDDQLMLWTATLETTYVPASAKPDTAGGAAKP